MLKYLILFSLILCQPVHALNLSKAPIHYAVEMEYFYQKPKSGVINDILKSFVKSGYLNKSEYQLMVAAFLSEIIKNKMIQPDELLMLDIAHNSSYLKTIAWSLHLANKKEYLTVLGNDSKTLIKQISSTPPILLNWDINKEVSILRMYWTAFMASGNTQYIDKIIESALIYATKKEKAPPACVQAAASLYDYAPRHPKVLERLKYYYNNQKDEYKSILSTIIEHAESKS